MHQDLLTNPDRMEGLSLVYVKALAAQAGFLVSVPYPDRDSIDLRVQAGDGFRPALDLQLKASTKLAPGRDRLIRFRLPIKNYDDLRGKTQTPRLLVVLELPADEAKWVTVTPEKLILRRRAYWLSLQQGFDEVEGQKTVTVCIPEANVLDADALRDLMERSRGGDL